MSLRGVAASAEVTALSTLIAAATCRGEILIVLCRYEISTGRENAASTRCRAGSALKPPTRTPATDTPAGITRVGAAAGAAAHARPAARSRAATVLSTRGKLNHVPRQSARVGLCGGAPRDETRNPGSRVSSRDSAFRDHFQ